MASRSVGDVHQMRGCGVLKAMASALLCLLLGSVVTAPTVHASPSAISWSSQTAAASNSWYGVAYGNGVFVAVSSSGAGNRVMTSPDGVTWTSRSSAADNEWRSVAFGNGLFVAVSVDGVGNRVMTSPDGVTWTSRSSAADNNWTSVTWGGVSGQERFVAVSGNGNVMTSPDGISWTSRTAAAANAWQSVTFGNGLFVAVSVNGAQRVMTSPDGITWTSRTSAAANAWYSVTFGSGLFVAVSTDGVGNRVMTSPDGVTWTSRTSASDNLWNAVTYGNGLFVAVGSIGSGERTMTSPDGISWTSRVAAQNNGWRAVTFGNGSFVAVSSDGTQRVMTGAAVLAPTFTASSPPSTGTVGSAYAGYTFIASGTAPITYAVASGSLPPGLTLATNGALSGNPTNDGTYIFTVSASNSVGTATTSAITITVTTDGSSADTVQIASPRPWLQSYGRSVNDECKPGWQPSWAEWARDKTGGWVCNRTVYWNGSTWMQSPNAVWGPTSSNQDSPWDGF